MILGRTRPMPGGASTLAVAEISRVGSEMVGRLTTAKIPETTQMETTANVLASMSSSVPP